MSTKVFCDHTYFFCFILLSFSSCGHYSKCRVVALLKKKWDEWHKMEWGVCAWEDKVGDLICQAHEIFLSYQEASWDPSNNKSNHFCINSMECWNLEKQGRLISTLLYQILPENRNMWANTSWSSPSIFILTFQKCLLVHCFSPHQKHLNDI